CARPQAPRARQPSNLVTTQPDQLTHAVGNDVCSDRLFNMWSPRQLKNDIWKLDDPNGPNRLSILGKEYYRFMDVLYIPCTTDLLTSQQIFTINRFRETRMHEDQQFQYNQEIKQ